MAGRPPKPTALKLLQGNPGKRALPKNEVKPRVGCGPPPWLPLDARVQWQRMAPRMIELGLLTEIDGEAFGAICVLTAQLAVLSQAGPSAGAAVAFCTKELRQLWGRFGMMPADRAKVTMTPPKTANPLEEFLGSR